MGNTYNKRKVNFYEKALFVKVDLATAVWWTQRLSVPFALYFYPRSLGELTLVGSSVHYGIRLFGLYRGAAIFFFFLAAFPEGWTEFARAVALCARSEALSRATTVVAIRRSAAAWRRCYAGTFTSSMLGRAPSPLSY